MHALKRSFIILFLTGLVVSHFTGCSTVPGTNRKALHLYSQETMAKMADSAFREMKKENKVSDDPEYNRRVNEVGSRIAAVVSDQLPADTQWEYIVFEDDDMINAFAMPGGKVGVYTGMFKVATNDNLLAIVLGHEVAHVVAQHGNERMSQNTAGVVGAIGVGVGTGVAGGNSRDIEAALGIYGAAASLGVLLPYSRLHETEADHLGLLYSSRAGYDPRVAPEFWERMQEESKGLNMPSFISTHPSNKQRIQKLREMMPEAVAEYNKAIEKRQNP